MHDAHAEGVRALPRILDWIGRENQRVAREGGAPILLEVPGPVAAAGPTALGPASDPSAP
jgi:hypothetical protein